MMVFPRTILPKNFTIDMKFSKFYLILFSMLTFASARGRDIEIVPTKLLKVQTVELQPMPYRINDTQLLKMNLQSRQDLCSRRLSEINEPILYSTMKNKLIPPAHLYEISGESVFAIRCPTLPATYISREWFGDFEQWYIRILDPPTDRYKFSFETADDVNEVTNDRDLTNHLKRESDLLYSMDVEERWRLCVEAAKFIRYKVTWDKNTRFFQPRFYSFTYNMWTETYLACRCDMSTVDKRYLFIRSDHSNSDTLTIVLTGSGNNDDLKGQELNPETKVIGG